MSIKKDTLSQFAICINNRDYPASLEAHKIYPIFRDSSEDDIRVIDESGEDYLSEVLNVSLKSKKWGQNMIFYPQLTEK